ncbi:hypothetical protein GIS00_24645 [Nakamurella sp. YIM 132087]|uniref:Uncharacterized protein n=1 Tax=Nakamurella alba TaxID=2665158 RepID=A0A7K1FUV0_9ACTN|nr:hypothetical protein [Nakamurella alba]MTD17129.1 hypothetical protein [Nakamurella alba]
MTDEASEQKAEAARGAAASHEVGMDADDPSRADEQGENDAVPDPVTGDTDHHAGLGHAADNPAKEPPA